MMGGYVSRGTTKVSLIVVITAIILAMFHGCAALQWMEEKDSEDRIETVGGER